MAKYLNKKVLIALFVMAIIVFFASLIFLQEKKQEAGQGSGQEAGQESKQKEERQEETNSLSEQDVEQFTVANSDFKDVQNYLEELGFAEFVEAKQVKKANITSTYATYKGKGGVVVAVKDKSAEYSISYLETIFHGGDEALLLIFDRNSTITLDLKKLYSKESEASLQFPEKRSVSGLSNIVPLAWATTFLTYEVDNVDPQCVIDNLLDALDWAELPQTCQRCIEEESNDPYSQDCLECQQELGENLTEVISESLEEGECAVGGGALLFVTKTWPTRANSQNTQIIEDWSFYINYTISNLGSSFIDRYNIGMEVYNDQNQMVDFGGASDSDGLYDGLSRDGYFDIEGGLSAGTYTTVVRVEYDFGDKSHAYGRVFNVLPEPKEGCTDANALNYDPKANIDDGSCQYSLPIAYIDSISPNPATEGDTITFDGHGSHPNGEITHYSWFIKRPNDVVVNLSSDFLSEDLVYDTSIGYLGESFVGLAGSHRVCFKVYDSTHEQWSEAVCQTLNIEEEVSYPPIAYIDSISPNPATEGDTITFEGHGEDPDGNIKYYDWRVIPEDSTFLSSDSFFLTEAEYTLPSLTYDTSIGYLADHNKALVGDHKIGLRVYDNKAQEWSEPVYETLTIEEKYNQKPIAIIDSVDPNPASVDSSVYIEGHGIDYDGEVIKCEIEFGDGQSTYENSDTCEASHSYKEFGTYQINLRVEDDRGESAQTSEQLVITSPITISGTLTWEPETVKEGEDSTYTVTITNESSIDIEVSQIYASWYWGQGQGYELAETEYYYPTVPLPWQWLTGAIPAGQTRDVFTHTGPTEGEGEWYANLFVYTDQGNFDILNVGHLTITD